MFLRMLCALLVSLAVSAGASAFDLQGHRGARGLAPENTLEGFALALGLGVTTLELDIAITKDGVPVITHDRTLNPDITRGPDGAWITDKSITVRSLAHDEVRRFDVGRINPDSRYATTFRTQKPVDGARIPKLADLFALVKKSGNNDVKFAIETKLSPEAPDDTVPPEAFVDILLAEIRKAGMQDRVQILSFDWRTLQLVQKRAPGMPTVYLSIQRRMDNIMANATGGSPWVAGYQYGQHGSVPKMIKAAGGTHWSVFFRDLDAGKLAEARTLGLKVLVWTVNELRDIDAMLDLGVDGIITDYPDRVRERMQRRGMALPAPTPVTP